MAKKCFWTVCAALLLSSFTSLAQTTLTGTVRGPAGQPLEGILLEAETTAQPPATAFVISGPDGRFALTLAATPASDSVRLSARALGYAEQLLRLANRSQALAIATQERTAALKKLVVQSAPITLQGRLSVKPPAQCDPALNADELNFLLNLC